MEKEIRVLLVETGKVPRTALVGNSMEALEKAVGGTPEFGCFLPERVIMVSNGEARAKRLPPNRMVPGTQEILYGTFLLCGFDEYDFTSLTPAQQMEFQSLFKSPQGFVLLGNGKVCPSPGELSAAVYRLWYSLKNGESVVMTKWGAETEVVPS